MSPNSAPTLEENLKRQLQQLYACLTEKLCCGAPHCGWHALTKVLSFIWFGFVFMRCVYVCVF